MQIRLSELKGSDSTSKRQRYDLLIQSDFDVAMEILRHTLKKTTRRLFGILPQKLEQIPKNVVRSTRQGQ
jgi:hypothetical protein